MIGINKMGCENLPCFLLQEYPSQLFWFGFFKDWHCPCCGIKLEAGYNLSWYQFKLRRKLKGMYDYMKCSNCKSVFTRNNPQNAWIKIS